MAYHEHRFTTHDGLSLYFRDYISVDRPQPDWESAAEAVKTQMPGSVVLSEECFARMGREYPVARLVTVRDTGHAPTLTEPECVAALNEFLRED